MMVRLIAAVGVEYVRDGQGEAASICLIDAIFIHFSHVVVKQGHVSYDLLA